MRQKVTVTIGKILGNILGREEEQFKVIGDGGSEKYHIPDNSLMDKHPIILASDKTIIVVIPERDLQAMNVGDVSPQNYISNANWNIGYFCESVGTCLKTPLWYPFDILTNNVDAKRYFSRERQGFKEIVLKE